ncbi:hypothetical protein RF11_04372 [Thelohanellus kitauei]|uniref:Uncharacterized protein n=1 Tax=Thelohanellus kitauei TaxID=669202 RepID=A0A0C2MN07_THEKT|nr:hypothetical protein RF11_04372 [Thelohanellus kitauei]
MFANLFQIDIAPTMFSEDWQLKERILDFKFDKFNKCVYYHVKIGIIRKCYGNKEQIAKPPLLFIEDITIMGIDFDYMNLYLFYFSKHEITAIHARSLVKTSIYKTEHFIRYLKLDVSRQYYVFKIRKMIIFYLEKGTRQSKICVLSFSAAVEVAAFDFDKDVHQIVFRDITLEIYTNEGIYMYRFSTDELKEVNLIFNKSHKIPFLM